MKKIFTTIVVVLMTLGFSQAQITPDRPNQTKSALTVGAGNLQVESGFLVMYQEYRDVYVRELLMPTNLFRYGIAEFAELRIVHQVEQQKVENNYSSSSSGISNLEIGVKFRLMQNESTTIGFLSHLQMPTGKGGRNVGTINKVAIEHKISDRYALAYNIGYNYFGEKNGDVNYSLAFGTSINDKVGIYIEPYGELTNIEGFILNFDSGFTYLLNENLQFDASFGVGVTREMNYFSLGLSWLSRRG